MTKTLLILIFIASIFALPVIGQVSDTLEVKSDSIPPTVKKEKLRFTGFRIGSDLVPLITYSLDQRFLRMEGSLEILLTKRYFASVDLGFAQNKRQGLPSFDYQNQGSFIRVGFHNNIWHTEPSQLNAIWSFGLGVGASIFGQELSYQIDDPLWGNDVGQENRQGLTATWLFFQSSMRAGIGKKLFLGPLLRLQWLVGKPEDDLLVIKDVPGYGRANNINLQLGYQIFYQIGY